MARKLAHGEHVGNIYLPTCSWVSTISHKRQDMIVAICCCPSFPTERCKAVIGDLPRSMCARYQGIWGKSSEIKIILLQMRQSVGIHT